MKLLRIAREEDPEFDPLFERVEHVKVEDIAPEVIDRRRDVNFNGSDIEEYDAVFADIPGKNAIFGRVLLEMLEEKDLELNYPSTAFFTMAKKNYLYHVLHEKEVPAPATATVASEKAVRGIEKELDCPMIARRFDKLVEEEKKFLETGDEAVDFVEGAEYPEDFIILQEFREGDKYLCLYAGGEVISLQDKTDGWRISTDNLQYSSVSSDQEELVRKAANSIGTSFAEVVLRGETVWDVNPNPDLEMYTDVSGKNAYEAVGSVLRGEDG